MLDPAAVVQSAADLSAEASIPESYGAHLFAAAGRARWRLGVWGHYALDKAPRDRITLLAGTLWFGYAFPTDGGEFWVGAGPGIAYASTSIYSNWSPSPDLVASWESTVGEHRWRYGGEFLAKIYGDGPTVETFFGVRTPPRGKIGLRLGLNLLAIVTPNGGTAFRMGFEGGIAWSVVQGD